VRGSAEVAALGRQPDHVLFSIDSSATTPLGSVALGMKQLVIRASTTNPTTSTRCGIAQQHPTSLLYVLHIIDSSGCLLMLFVVDDGDCC
jgi:hypothetical protein